MRLAGTLLALLLAGSAQAQTQAQPPFSLTLYDQPNYGGASITLYRDNPAIGTTGFTNRARSAQVRGSWRLCEGGGYRNRCEVLSANVPDLAAYGLAGQVGSAQMVAAPPIAAYARPEALPEARAEAPAQAPSEPYPYPTNRDYAAAGPRPERVPERPVAYPAAPALAREAAPGGVDGASVVFFPRPSAAGRDVPGWSPRAADDFCRAQGLGGALYFDSGRPAAQDAVLTDVLCRR